MMALRMTPRRAELLVEIYQAGPRGVDQIGHLEAAILEHHGLVESFSTPLRMRRQRFRTTWRGRRYARWFIEGGELGREHGGPTKA